MPAAEPQQVQHLVGDAQTRATQRRRQQPGPHGRQERRGALTEQADHLREGEDAVGGDVEDARAGD